MQEAGKWHEYNIIFQFGKIVKKNVRKTLQNKTVN